MRIVGTLHRVAEQCSYLLNRGDGIASGTRAVLGEGRTDTDRVILDVVKALECIGRARTAVEVALDDLRDADPDQVDS